MTGRNGGNCSSRSISSTLALGTVESAFESTSSMHDARSPWIDATSARMIGRTSPSAQRNQLPSILMDADRSLAGNLIDEPTVVIGMGGFCERQRIERRFGGKRIPI